MARKRSSAGSSRLRRKAVSTQKEQLEILHSVALFEGLSATDLRKIRAVGKEVAHAEGSAVLKEGQSGVGFHLVLEGTARVVVGSRTLGRFGPGYYFGELSLIDGGPRTATVYAETAMRTLSIPRWSFMPLLDKYPTITKKMLIEACRRLRETTKSGPLA